MQIIPDDEWHQFRPKWPCELQILCCCVASLLKASWLPQSKLNDVKLPELLHSPALYLPVLPVILCNNDDFHPKGSCCEALHFMLCALNFVFVTSSQSFDQNCFVFFPPIVHIHFFGSVMPCVKLPIVFFLQQSRKKKK